MHQIVFADLTDFSKGTINAPERSIILNISPKDLIGYNNIIQAVSGMGDILFGVSLTARQITDYIYLNDSNKDSFIKELHIINSIGEELGRPINFICPMSRQFPEWDTCKQHVTGLFGQYTKLFSHIRFCVTNSLLKTSGSPIVDVSLLYMLTYFQSVPGVYFLPDVTNNGPDSAIKLVRDFNSRCVAIIDKTSKFVADNVELPFAIKGVTVWDMIAAERQRHIPTIKIVQPNIAGTDAFFQDMLKAINTMSK